MAEFGQQRPAVCCKYMPQSSQSTAVLALILATNHFRFRGDLQSVERYQKLYNEYLPQRALDHKTPLQATMIRS